MTWRLGWLAWLDGDARFGVFEREHVVGAVARHGDVAAAVAERLDLPLLLLRGDATKGRRLNRGLGELAVVSSGSLCDC